MAIALPACGRQAGDDGRYVRREEQNRLGLGMASSHMWWEIFQSPLGCFLRCSGRRKPISCAPRPTLWWFARQPLTWAVFAGLNDRLGALQSERDRCQPGWASRKLPRDE